MRRPRLLARLSAAIAAFRSVRPNSWLVAVEVAPFGWRPVSRHDTYEEAAGWLRANRSGFTTPGTSVRVLSIQEWTRRAAGAMAAPGPWDTLRKMTDRIEVLHGEVRTQRSLDRSAVLRGRADVDTGRLRIVVPQQKNGDHDS